MPASTVVSSRDVAPNPDNPTGRMDARYHILIQSWKREPESAVAAQWDSLRDLVSQRQRAALQAARESARSGEELAEAIQDALRLTRPGPELAHGIRAFASRVMEAEADKLQEAIERATERRDAILQSEARGRRH